MKGRQVAVLESFCAKHGGYLRYFKTLDLVLIRAKKSLRKLIKEIYS